MISIEKERRNWVKIFDIPNFVTAVVLVIIFVALLFLPVNQLYVPPNDSLSDFPHKEKSTISTALVIVIVVVLGLAFDIIFFFLSYKWPSIFRPFAPFTNAWVMISTLAAANICVNIFKCYVGRARPDFYALCGRDGSIKNCPGVKESKVKDEFKSWPSGHSVTAMSGCLYLAYFTQKVFKSRNLYSSILPILLIILAVYIGSTRIRDFKHHPDDVIAGFFIGALFTDVIWRRCYKIIFPKDHEKIEAMSPQVMNEP